MGRHRRSAAGRPHASDFAQGYAEYPPPPSPPAPAGAPHHRKKRDGVPLRTGLLGASAAVAMGAVAVTTGLIPGGGGFTFGGDGSRVQAADSPDVTAQGGTTGGAVDDRAPSAASRDRDRSTPSATPSRSASSAPPRSSEPSKGTQPSRTSAEDSGGNGTRTRSASPSTSAPSTPARTKAPSGAGGGSATTSEKAAAAQVLSLVNQERSKVGCSAVTADSGLASLATAFSDDMAARDFFDHTDPDGATPWDRAKKAGITDLGGENIARGQANAQSVMDSWMNSPGHKANILNCDFKTLGVGVHFGSGGPWWTQNFGY
ncbi:CAP domain-containing protein [Streptomyces sp. NPDC059897]|uniref:CAP domain-containing protein n=1 Tax=Streptomyces sp. NPDC059897 TaxID=3346994 RepID=UPI003649386B